MRNRITFAAVSISGYTKLRVTQSTTRAFKYINFKVCNLVCINKMNYSELALLSK